MAIFVDSCCFSNPGDNFASVKKKEEKKMKMPIFLRRFFCKHDHPKRIGTEEELGEKYEQICTFNIPLPGYLFTAIAPGSL